MTESGPPATDPPADPAAPHDETSQATPHQDTGEAPVAEAPQTEAPAGEGSPPSWWHSSHPTFAGLVGFFTGVAYVIVVPGIYAALLSVVFSDQTAQRLFPLVAVIIVVPLVLLVPRKTRRFA